MNESRRTNLTLFDFGKIASIDSWFPVNDSVMGGVSSSEMVWQENQAVFKGVVSPENNGGFCSVRSLLSSAITENADHIWIESSSEELLFALTVRTNRTRDGINYQADFTPVKPFTRIDIPLVGFRAQYRGRFVLDAPELLAQDIKQIGIIISDQQYGSFELAIKKIGVAF